MLSDIYTDTVRWGIDERIVTSYGVLANCMVPGVCAPVAAYARFRHQILHVLVRAVGLNFLTFHATTLMFIFLFSHCELDYTSVVSPIKFR